MSVFFDTGAVMSHCRFDPKHVIRALALFATFFATTAFPAKSDGQPVSNHRRPADERDLKSWLTNMVCDHEFSFDEVAAATGMTESEIKEALGRHEIRPKERTPRPTGAPLRILPYPGGRHPRIGFLDGAVRPQRETKISVFTPWDPTSYVVLDVPEAIWSNHGLTYLAHTHIPTIFDKQKITLPRLEWQIDDNATLRSQRRLPNGIAFGTMVRAHTDHLQMEMWLTNGTDQPLSDLRVQNCAMLKGAKGFAEQTNDNKLFWNSYAACRSESGDRWVILAWEPIHRPWGNAPCPCLHADPKFADCPAGESRHLRGWFSFYEGEDIHQELRRIEETNWKQAKLMAAPQRIRGMILDGHSEEPLAGRVHIRDMQGQWYDCHSLGGTEVHYRSERGDIPFSREVHTTLSPHPFTATLGPGRYELRIERGKEYIPLIREIVVPGANHAETLRFPLKRWIDMAKRGWYSGDTHVHRKIEDLPNIMLAEDLNVTFPLSYWVTVSGIPPTRGDRQVRPVTQQQIKVDPRHVIYPMNTEYEIFSVGPKRHTLGAVFVLNHQEPLDVPVPPVAGVATQARAEGALLDLDKHSWPWSLMLNPVMNVDLFELSNNHIWQTNFGYHRWTLDAAADYMNLELDERGFTEFGWLDFGFKTYYALLNCGFPMRVTAGTASGAHPVQLGFGRVYVSLPDGFDGDAWIQGLRDGRSFVSNGPMLFVAHNDQSPGHHFRATEATSIQVLGTAESRRPLDRIEIVQAGKIVRRLTPTNNRTDDGRFVSHFDETISVSESSWICVRCFEQHPDERVRFAHTNPVHITIAGKPLPANQDELEYMARRMREELARNADVLDDAALEEYRRALAFYDGLRNNSYRIPIYPDATAPPARSMSEVAQLLSGSEELEAGSIKPLRVVLVAGPKDHKRGEHDYPAWQQVWSRLLANSPALFVESAWEFPTESQLKTADVLVFYQRGRWNADRAAAIDPFLSRGGGLVYIHWAVDGRGEQAEMAKRIGLASLGGKIRFRHGPLDIDFSPGKNHPIARNFDRIRWVDETYWSLTGDEQQIQLMGTSLEEGNATPQFWTVERNGGRVFVSIPGHYMWTFDDPAFRTLLLRGIMWTGRRPVDSLNNLVTLDARVRD